MTRTKSVLLVLLLSAATHLYGIASPVLDYHHHRQANTAAIALNYHENGMRFLHPQINWAGDGAERAATEFPLYMYLLGALWGLFGLGEIWGRILSAACSAATAVLLLSFLERWLSRRAALFGALFFSLIPVEIYFGRTVQPEALALLASMGAFLAFDSYLLARKNSAPPHPAKTPALWLAAWACAALAIGHKIPYGYLLGVAAVLAYARLDTRAFRDPGSLALIPLTLAAVFAWYKYASSGSYVVPTHTGQFLVLLNYSRLPYYMFFQFFSRFPELAVTWPAMPVWAAGAWALRKSERPVKILFWGWFACVAFYVSAGGAYVHHHEYTALPWALVNAALFGLGLEYLIGRVRQLSRTNRNRARAALAALLFAIPVYSAVRIKHWYKVKDLFLLTAAGPITSFSARSDLFLCNERAESLFLFYIRRNGWSAAVTELRIPPLEWTQEAAAKGAKFFMTRRDEIFRDRSHPLSRPIYENYPLVYEDKNFLVFKIRKNGN